MHHNEPEDASHNHIFFGNPRVLDRPNPNTWTYSGLVGTSTTCQNPDDFAVYWVPDLVYTAGPNKGESVPLRRFFAYYRTWDSKNRGPAGSTFSHSPDTRLVAGNAAQPASSYQDVRHFNWTCDQRSSRTGPYQTITDANCARASGQAVYPTAHIDLPPAGTATPLPTGPARSVTPATTPTTATSPGTAATPPTRPALRLTVKWDYQGDGSNVALVTDLEQRKASNSVEPGQTLHGDFWNPWVQDGYQRLVQDCVLRNKQPAQLQRSCGTPARRREGQGHPARGAERRQRLRGIQQRPRGTQQRPRGTPAWRRHEGRAQPACGAYSQRVESRRQRRLGTQARRRGSGRRVRRTRRRPRDHPPRRQPLRASAHHHGGVGRPPRAVG